MGKFQMPTAKQFLARKKLGMKNENPVWVYLEKEMRANEANKIKPYNEKVGNWLKYLKDMKFHFACEKKRKYNRIMESCAPPWYIELSLSQREVLLGLKNNIGQDLAEGTPRRVTKALKNIGITLDIAHDILMSAMHKSKEDPGLFFWHLFSEVYKVSPKELLPKYSINAMYMLSSIVLIDFEECIHRLDELLKIKKITPKQATDKKKRSYYSEPRVPLGMYLHKMDAYMYSNHRSEKQIKDSLKNREKPPQLDYKIRLRSKESYENLKDDDSFITKRVHRFQKEAMLVERVCKYKFWKPPVTLRNMDPTQVTYVLKLKMLETKAKTRHLKFKPPYDIIHFNVGTVAYINDTPYYNLATIIYLPSGYEMMNGGVVWYNGEGITLISRYCVTHWPEEERCVDECSCLAKWDAKISDYIETRKCKCGHYYDYNNLGKSTEPYFYKPTYYFPHFFDRARMYQQDTMQDFVRDTFAYALKSRSSTVTPSYRSIDASTLSDSQLLESFLADLSDTPLIIPHLPGAEQLMKLQAWIRRRVKGKLTPKQAAELLSQSKEHWFNIDYRISFLAKSYIIPFKREELDHLNYNHRKVMQKLHESLLHDFVMRNRMKQIQQTRLFWPTMHHDFYPSKTFMDIFFLYMPSRPTDIHLLNVYSDRDVKRNARTCRLDINPPAALCTN